MSDESYRADDSDDGIANSTRVGTFERDEAVALLSEHWHAGRLDPSEHELRVTRARAAVTKADLDALFNDLPQPIPPTATPSARPASSRTAPETGRGGFLEDKRDTIMALTPFAALILFLLTRSWLWFLMVPVMGILVYGPGGKKNPHQRGRADRGHGADQ